MNVAVVLSADAVPVSVIPGSVVVPGHDCVPVICVPVWVSVISSALPPFHVPVHGFGGRAAAGPGWTAPRRAAMPARRRRWRRRTAAWAGIASSFVLGARSNQIERRRLGGTANHVLANPFAMRFSRLELSLWVRRLLRDAGAGESVSRGS